jgi:hypothetical protein
MSQEIDNKISDNNSEEEEYIRPIDEIYTDKLIDNEENSFEEDDEEFKLALNVSKNDYYDNEYNNVLDNVFKISLDEYNENIKKGRKESLSLFLKKIEKLSYTKEDIEIKTYIMDTLNSYFNLIIEFVYIEEELYQKIYKIIDSYYLIPIEKGNKKTAITKEEDLIIRSIFLEK